MRSKRSRPRLELGDADDILVAHAQREVARDLAAQLGSRSGEGLQTLQIQARHTPVSWYSASPLLGHGR